jgi:hypothetical protein
MPLNLDFKNLFKKKDKEMPFKPTSTFDISHNIVADISSNDVVLDISSNDDVLDISSNNVVLDISSNSVVLDISSNDGVLDISSNSVVLDISSNHVTINKTLNQNRGKKIVVIYTFFKSYVADYNLNFFTKTELTYKKNIDYIIVINGYSCDIVFPDIKNLTVLKRENTGFDFGGHSYALNYLKNKNIKYKYYFFMNSGVFGPVISPNKKKHWAYIFIKKIVGLVKIVGTSIVCLPKKDLGGYGPKVEGFFFATDSEGLKLLLEEKTIFYNHANKTSAIVNGEYGVTRCIMKYGYTIDCMLKRYRRVDWRDKKNWNLNNNLHPTRKNSYFGKSINPFEVIFHKWYWAGLPKVNYDIIANYVEQTGFE